MYDSFDGICVESTSFMHLFMPAFRFCYQEQKQRILDKYGGSEHLNIPDARLLVGQTESYVEYDRTGRVVKGAPKVIGWLCARWLLRFIVYR